MRRVALAWLIAGALVGESAAFAQSKDEPEPVDPYARDPNAPVPQADEARGWRVRPVRSRRVAVDWVKKQSRGGAKVTLKLVFAPVSEVLKLNERYAVVRRVESLFYNDERTAGILPSASFISGFGSAFGVNLFHKDMFGNDERSALKLEFGGVNNQSYQLSFDFPNIADGRFYTETLGRVEGNATQFFRGIGHPPHGDDPLGGPYDPREVDFETRYKQRRLLGILGAGVQLGRPRELRVGFSLVYNRREFEGLDEDGVCDTDDDEAIECVYDTSALSAFEDGEDTLEITLDVTLDTRDRAGKTGSGILVDLFAGGAPSLDGNPYLHYGIEASLFQTLFRRGRVMVLRTMLEGVEGDEGNIPFTELPRLGGPARLRGYRLDRFRDDLAAIGTLEYRYPIHHSLSGLLFVEAGKVARTYGKLASTDHWQPGFGGGLVLHTLEDVQFRLDLSYGEGFEVFLSTDALAAFAGRRRRL